MSDLLKWGNSLDKHSHIGILLLRIFIGGRLFYGVIDNVLSWNRMVEFADFLSQNQFPFPIFSAVLSVYVQFLGAILIFVGIKTRVASILLAINFLIALIGVHFPANDSIEAMTPAMAMLFGCLTIFFTGPGKISLEGYLASR